MHNDVICMSLLVKLSAAKCEGIMRIHISLSLRCYVLVIFFIKSAVGEAELKLHLQSVYYTTTRLHTAQKSLDSTSGS